ncbi:MAG: hypothetical protein E7I07_21920 [Enterobacter asburiae]|nr:hypothetical protein [Enterobacter asburiae]
MSHLKWMSSHQTETKMDRDEEVVKKITLKHDATYHVVILNGNEIMTEDKWIADDYESPAEKGCFGFFKGGANERVNESRRYKDKLRDAYMSLYINGFLGGREFSNVGIKTKTLTPKEYKIASGAIKKAYLNMNLSTQDHKTLSESKSVMADGCFYGFDLKLKEGAIGRAYYDAYDNILKNMSESAAKRYVKDVKQYFTVLVEALYTFEVKGSSNATFSRSVSGASMRGYLDGVTSTSHKRAIKPYVSLVERESRLARRYNVVVSGKATTSQIETSSHRNLMERMNDQASSMQVFDLNNAEGIARFLEFYAKNT